MSCDENAQLLMLDVRGKMNLDQGLEYFPI